MPTITIERELELIDGMIEVQLRHSEQCDRIANRTMAEKQKAWDMERVALLRKMRAALAAQPAEPVTWAGCGDCDCSFSCHNGEARCIRLKLAPAAVLLTKEQRELFDLILHHYGPDKRLQSLRDLIAAAGDKP